MAGKRATLRLTRNFEHNLAAIESFLAAGGAPPQAFGALLDELLEKLIPNLERYPAMGRPFLNREARSIEAREKIALLKARIGSAEIREAFALDYVILYAVTGAAIHLLAIKHPRQLSFDFGALWPSA